MIQRPRAAPGARNAYREAFHQATQTKSSQESMEICAELEAGVEALRIHYEQYFLGLSRLPPRDEHDLVRAAVLRLRQSFVRNTAARFRVQSLHNRFLAYERMWQRTCREIEEGTYRRDIFKMKLRGKGAAPTEEAQRATAQIQALKQRMEQPIEDHDVDLSESEGPAGAEAAVPAVTRAAKAVLAPVRAAVPAAAASRPSPEGLPEQKLRALYDAYVTAKKRCRESTDGLTLESLANTLRQQVPELLAGHKATAIDFKVVIKGGKASLKAVPR